ncbi:MAG: response regulator [Magnetococcales bacterium]|nr:response regulator [Magnetococcales bacterium]
MPFGMERKMVLINIILVIIYYFKYQIHRKSHGSNLQHRSVRGGGAVMNNMEGVLGSFLFVDDDPEIFQYLVEALKSRGRAIFIHTIRRVEGRVELRFSTEVDCSDSKQTKAALRKNEHQLREIAATMATPMYVIDREWRITFINPAALTLLGWKEGEVLGNKSNDLFHHSCADGRLCPLEESPVFDVLEQNRVVTSNNEVIWLRDGNRLPISLIAVPIHHGQDARGAVVVFREFSRQDQEKEEEEGRITKDHDAAGYKAQKEFLDTMSHEIRTPMNVVLGMNDVLLETDLTDEQRHYLEIMSRSCGAVMAIINDILDFSRIESGQFTLVDKSYSPRVVLDETLRIMQLSAGQKGIALHGDVLPSVPVTIMGDEGRLTQVLVNLISNAIKFSSQGAIRVQLALHDTTADTLLFSVSDSGIGIAKENQERIFAPFTQADGGIHRRYGGTGLGLSISRRLVEWMGGVIWLESLIGRGSTFFFTLPLRIADPPPPLLRPALSTPSTPKRSLRVLLVEDSLDNQLLLKVYLSKTIHHLTLVNDGLEALARVRKEPFDLILMDIQMPVLDGYGATRQIRQWERDEGRTPLFIIALSAHASIGRKEESLAAGCNEHLTKPIKKQTLLDLLDFYASLNVDDVPLDHGPGGVDNRPILVPGKAQEGEEAECGPPV